MSAHAQSGADRAPTALLRDREFLALASVRFVSGMAFATIIIALALYADLFDASGVAAGFFGAAYSVVRLFIVLPLGRKIDVGNSKRYLLAGLGLNVLMLVGFVLARSIEHVIVLRGLQGLGSATLWITGMAVVGEISPEASRGRWMGTYSQVRSIASLTGDVVGGALLFLYGFGITYGVLIALALVSTTLVLAFVRNDPGSRADPDAATGVETFRRLLRRRAITALVAFRFAFSFGKNAVILFLPIYARTAFGMSALAIGGILAGGKLTKGLTQGYVGDLADRTGRLEWYIFAGTISYAVGTALIPAAGVAMSVIEPVSLSAFGRSVTVTAAGPVLFLAYAVLGVADSIRLPTSMTMFVQEGEHFDAVAGSLSLRSVSWQVGGIIGPLSVGYVLDQLSFLAGFWLAAALMVVAGVAFIALFEAEPPPTVGPEPMDDD